MNDSSNWLDATPKDRELMMQESLQLLIGELRGEACGFCFILFESDGEIIEAVAESIGILNPDLFIEYLVQLGALNKIKQH